jgi:hypothetical protein
MSVLPQGTSSKLKVPPLRLSRGYAYCFAGRRQVRLGRVDDPETERRYRTFVAEWLAAGCRWPDDKRPEAVLTVQGLVDAYTNYVAQHYRRPSTGEATREGENLKHAVVELLELFRDLPATKVDALVVKRVRAAMVERKLCRRTVNDRVQRIQRMVRWAAEERLVPPSVHHEVKLVSPLKPGRGGAHDNPPRVAVSIEHVEAVKKHLPKPLAALVDFMLLTGARSFVGVLRGDLSGEDLFSSHVQPGRWPRSSATFPTTAGSTRARYSAAGSRWRGWPKVVARWTSLSREAGGATRNRFTRVRATLRASDAFLRS